jgi:hypothetical protein
VLKLGILEKKSFIAGPSAGLFARLRHRVSRSRVSLRLLDVPLHPSKEDVEIFERLMPFIRLSGGTYRSTYRQRFCNLDPLVNALLMENFSSSLELRVEDLAASTCLTSREWAISLLPLFPRLRFGASDLLLFLVEVERVNSSEVFVSEPNGHPLQYIRPPFVIPMDEREPWSLPLNRLLYAHAWRRWRIIERYGAVPDSWVDSICDETLSRDNYRFRKLSLIHPDALDLTRQDARFVIRRQSVFERLPVPCHVIRSMNIFNRAYFSEGQLEQGARSVIDSLLAGGFWILGRTTEEQPPAHEVTIFRKLASGSLEVLERLGAGSEIETIALSVSRSLEMRSSER